MLIVPPSHSQFDFDPAIEPVLRVRPGDVVRFETSAEPAERLFEAGRSWARSVNTRRINTVTGPVYVEGAEPGGALAVEILEVETLDWGWNMWLPGYGMLGQRAREPMLQRVPIHDGQVWLTDELSVPLAPMIGCLGLAPASGKVSTLAPVYPFAGNFDMVQMKPGNTVYFPIQTPGGLFSLGDLHAAMGVGESTSIAIECAGSATVRFDLRPDLELSMPRVASPERLYVIGIADNRDCADAARVAIREMYQLLTLEAGVPEGDAQLIVSAAVDLEFGGPASAIVLASVPLALIR